MQKQGDWLKCLKMAGLAVLVVACLMPWSALALSDPDEYEDDDVAADYSWIGVDGPLQSHTFDAEDDEDWARFFAFSGDSLVIETINLSCDEISGTWSTDTYIEVFEDDGVTPVVSDDNSGIQDYSSYISWTFPEEGFYYVRVTVSPIADPWDEDLDYAYDLWVHTESGASTPGEIEGYILDADTHFPIPFAQVMLTDFGNLLVQADETGYYLFKVLPGKTYTVWANATDYGPDSEVKVLPAGETVTQNLYLTGTSANPIANFVGDPLSGSAPLEVTFTEMAYPGTSPITSWLWTFGDGDTSNETDPVHTYEEAGSYTVSLTVTTAEGTSKETKDDYLLLDGGTPDDPVANFVGVPRTGTEPLMVEFTDASYPGSSAITSWLWDFGDENTSPDPDPVHIYAEAGSYTVSLTITTGTGGDAEEKTDYIVVSADVPMPATGSLGLVLIAAVCALTGAARQRKK